MPERIIFTGKQEARLESFAPRVVGPNEVGVRALYTLISTGTETIIYNRLFEPGSHWDKLTTYPFYPGYNFVGEVAEIGDDVESLKIGDRVALQKHHTSYAVANAADCCLVPDGIDLKEAVWFTLAHITFHGLRKANYEVGESTLIIGAGPIGQAFLRWARAVGADPIIVLDTVEKRLQHARDGGIKNTICLPVDSCRDEVSRLTNGAMPTVVVDTTGNAAVLPLALELAADQGRVLLIGDTGSPSGQHITNSVVLRGVSVLGAHGTHNTLKWNVNSIASLFFRMVLEDRIDMHGLNTHEFKPAECAQAYQLANERRSETMGILFNWTE